jgi:hypothetical protein
MKISIDFDDTLSTERVQKFVKGLIHIGQEIHIVTSRMNSVLSGNPNWNNDLHEVAEWIGIPEERIHFLNLTPKYKFFKNNSDFLCHLDDDSEEIDDINRYTKVVGVLYNQSFSSKILELIKYKI